MMVKIGTFRLIEEVEPKPRFAFIQPGQEPLAKRTGAKGGIGGTEEHPPCPQAFPFPESAATTLRLRAAKTASTHVPRLRHMRYLAIIPW
jgi:hypothetical protein